METFVQTTFIIIVAFAAVNMIASFGIYAGTKRDLYLRLALFWFTLILNFLVQSQAQSAVGELAIIFSFGFGIIPLNLLGYATLTFYQVPFPWRIISAGSLFAVLLTLVFQSLGFGFTIKALPIAGVAAAPLLYTLWIILIKNKNLSTPLLKVHAILLFLLSVHCFNFAIFRMEPEAQLWGWPIAYGLYQLLAILIPSVVLDFSHREEQGRLQSIIDLRIQELKSAHKEQEALLLEKNYLLRTLTHDINNPLMVIQGRLALARRGPVKMDSFINSIEGMLVRIKGLIHQVKTFERLHQTTEGLVLEDLNLMTCVAEVLELFEERCQQKNITIEFPRAKFEKCHILVDHEAFINSVLPNILGNAIKFSHNGGVIRMDIEPHNPNHIVLSVTDSGLGMSPTMIKNIYEFSTNSSRRGTGGEAGTGFGIPILAKTMKAFGGSISFTSEMETPEKPGSTRVELTLQGTMDVEIAQIA
ncbi:MAG: hypothetical protein IPK04_16185 [Bdellovibrionales bacterium]|nr:hypothetical protein [Bdellovibrionales bacterium]